MLSRTKSCILAGLLALALCLSGCGSDETGGNNANNGQTQDTGVQDASDTSGEQDTTEQEDGGEEDATSDASDTEEQDTTTEDAADDTSAQDAADDATSEDATDTADEDVDTRGACGTGTDQSCAYPATSSTCDQGDWGAGSFINTFTLENDGDCCYDFDGDGNDDSGLARLKSIIKTLTGFEFNEIIRIQIESGGLTYLFTYSDWSNPVNDPDANLDVVFGTSTSTWTEKQNDNGVFTVTANSVDANGDPLSQLDTADVCSSHITVRGGQAPLRVPIGSELIEVTLNDVHLDADVVAPTDLSASGRVGLENGELGGWITLDDIFGGLNGVAQACDCLQKDVFVRESGSWTCVAEQADQDDCATDPNAPAFCQDFLSRPAECGLAATTLERNADFDGQPVGNPDGTLDSYTVGAKFTATGAELTGTQR